ncbi:unnamed protein product, partial [Callosobruchus maculatus]
SVPTSFPPLCRLHTIRQACPFELNSPPEDRLPERVYIPVDLSVKTVQAAGEKSKYIPSNWKNPEGIYRIGQKNAFDLYPDRLKERMKSDYKKKHWDENHRKAVSDVSRELAEFDTKHPNSEYGIEIPYII